ncbi:MAG TPA: zinc ribbon domain-containing protein, partial [Sporichthya sp.]|nr:zinc ribbon domain-containing protein [Sporichthya sp.]
MSRCVPCGHDYAAGAKYCIECGAPTPRECPACHSDVTVSQNFCAECGTNLQAPIAGARPHSRDFSAEAECKQVTVVFADVAGSMQLAEQFDADEWTQIIAGWFTA